MNRIFQNDIPPRSRVAMAADRWVHNGGLTVPLVGANHRLAKARAICEVSDAMSKRLIHEHPNAKRGLDRLLSDIFSADDGAGLSRAMGGDDGR